MFDIYKKFIQRRLTFAITNLEFSLSLLGLCVCIYIYVRCVCIYIHISCVLKY